MEPQTRTPRVRPHAPALVGTALVMAAGLMTGGLLRAGDLFDAPPAPVPLAAEQGADNSVVSFMMDADGHIPDYVIGTDVTAPPSEARLYAVTWAPDPAPAPAEDWSTAPSLSGDILDVGAAAPRESQAPVAASVDSHAIDASEVAASGMTARVPPKPPADPKDQAAADHRDGQAALASAGFTTQTP